MKKRTSTFIVAACVLVIAALLLLTAYSHLRPMHVFFGSRPPMNPGGATGPYLEIQIAQRIAVVEWPGVSFGVSLTLLTELAAAPVIVILFLRWRERGMRRGFPLKEPHGADLGREEP